MAEKRLHKMLYIYRPTKWIYMSAHCFSVRFDEVARLSWLDHQLRLSPINLCHLCWQWNEQKDSSMHIARDSKCQWLIFIFHFFLSFDSNYRHMTDNEYWNLSFTDFLFPPRSIICMWYVYMWKLTTAFPWLIYTLVSIGDAW